jgi:hypothetical protein
LSSPLNGQSGPLAGENPVRRLTCPMLTETDVEILLRIDTNIRKVAEKIRPVTDWVKPIRNEVMTRLPVSTVKIKLAS